MPYDPELNCIRETEKFPVTMKVAAWDSKTYRGPQAGARGLCFEQRKIDGDWFYYIKFPDAKSFHIAYADQCSK